MSARTLAARLPRTRRGLFARIAAALDLRASRARLAQLDAHMLRDIGVSPEEAAAELDRSLWDAPVGWRR